MARTAAAGPRDKKVPVTNIVSAAMETGPGANLKVDRAQEAHLRQKKERDREEERRRDEERDSRYAAMLSRSIASTQQGHDDQLHFPYVGPGTANAERGTLLPTDLYAPASMRKMAGGMTPDDTSNVEQSDDFIFNVGQKSAINASRAVESPSHSYKRQVPGGEYKRGVQRGVPGGVLVIDQNDERDAEIEAQYMKNKAMDEPPDFQLILDTEGVGERVTQKSPRYPMFL